MNTQQLDNGAQLYPKPSLCSIDLLSNFALSIHHSSHHHEHPAH